MLHHKNLTSPLLQRLIKQGAISFAGNKQLLIYGRLHCNSGKRMKINNRVFFADEIQAIENNYRPCGHCMKEQYKRWKHAQ